jgi:2-phospho-L-lactate guanylyltransferase
MLQGGANDLGGTLMEETISRMAGSEHGSEKTVAELRAIAEGIGRQARERTTTHPAKSGGLPSMITSQIDRYGVVVPIRSLKTGKSRLLTDSDALRQQLAFAFFLDTVAALECSVAVDRIVVVSDDDTIRRCVRARCESVADGETGLAAAVDIGVGRLQEVRHMGPVAVVLPDLPYATTDAFDAMFLAADEHPRAFLTDSAGDGTTCVTAESADMMVHRFGPGSARAHAEAGLVELGVSVPELRADVDVPSDMRHQQSLSLGVETGKVLNRWRVGV